MGAGVSKNMKDQIAGMGKKQCEERSEVQKLRSEGGHFCDVS